MKSKNTNLFAIYTAVYNIIILFGTTCKSNIVRRASYHSIILQYFYTLQ